MKIILKLLLTFIISTLFYACSTLQRSDRLTEKEVAPGVTVINSDLMVDKTEISNFNWLEYMYWTKRIFGGTTSEEYINTLPDTNVWKEGTCLEKYRTQYLRNPAYRDFPVVGITQQQAVDFCKWRSDRVFEYILIREGLLSTDTKQNAYNYFTIERYYNGLYTKDSTVNSSLTHENPNFELLYPHYSLPTLAERNLIINYTDSIGYEYQTKYSRIMNKLAEGRKRMIQLDITICDSTKLLEKPTVSTTTGVPEKRNFDQIYNIRGNVAEWLNEENLTAGGGWPHNTKYVVKNDTVSSYSANSWTGFRCAFRWKKWKE